MKPKAALLVTILMTITFFACTKKQPLGKWSDIIELSQKEFTFKSAGDSALIVAKGKWRGINGVSLDTSKINVYSLATDACNFIYTDANVKIVSKDCDTLFIRMNANTTSSDRTLHIGLSAGDYADGIKITQTKQ
jgi:hypothetical protein